MADALPICFLNGEYLPAGEASISPFDRGFLFADAIYEVIPVFDSKVMLADSHLARLGNSLSELRIPNPHTEAEWREIFSMLIQRNGGGDIAIYIQVSRGAETGRDHFYPDNMQPTVFAMATAITRGEKDLSGISAITLEDTRWARCDIKSTSLLANIMLRQEARNRGADDTILVKDGNLVEAASASVITVEGDNLVFRPNSTELLPGTTRAYVLELAQGDGFTTTSEIVSEQRLRDADEIWLLSATKGVVPVIELDGKPVGEGKAGKVWQRIHELYEANKAMLS